MSEKWTGDSAENKYVLTREEVQDMDFQRQLFQNPIEKLRHIRSVLKAKEDSDEKVDQAFMHGLKIIIDALGDNVYGFDSKLPYAFQVLTAPESTVDEMTRPIISICKACGVTKNGLRQWIIKDFTTDAEGEPVTEKIAFTHEQKRQLDIIEEMYESE